MKYVDSTELFPLSASARRAFHYRGEGYSGIHVERNRSIGYYSVRLATSGRRACQRPMTSRFGSSWESVLLIFWINADEGHCQPKCCSRNPHVISAKCNGRKRCEVPPAI